MNPSPANLSATKSRTPLLLASLGLALAVGLADAAMNAMAAAEAMAPGPISVARFRLENNAGKHFRRGSSSAFTGWLTDHATNGTVRLRTAVVDGRLHGVSEGWAANGTLELREFFHRGLPHGPRITWHANGQKRSEGRMIFGQQQGGYRQWAESGALAAEAGFKDGKPHGLSRAWHPSGCLKAEAMMSHGEVVTRHFYPDGERREPTLLAGAYPQ